MKNFSPVLINDIYLLESQDMQKVHSRVWLVIAILNYSFSCLIKSSKECPAMSLTEKGTDHLSGFEET